MARARNIKPSFFINEGVNACQPLARLLFIGLWCLADRLGRLPDSAKRIKWQVLPADDTDVDSLLAELGRHGFILRYEVDGQKYIQINNFEKHQRPHVKESASTIPAPEKPGKPEQNVLIPDTGYLIADTGLRIPDSISCQEDLAPDNGTATKPTAGSPTANEPTEARPTDRQGYPSAFEEFWLAYPNRGGRKRGKQKAFSLWKLVRVADRQSVVQAATHYAASRESREGFARDPERFLKAEWWRDWLEPQVDSRVPTDEDLENWNPVTGGLG